MVKAVRINVKTKAVFATLTVYMIWLLTYMNIRILYDYKNRTLQQGIIFND